MDANERATAERAIGLAWRELGDLPAAARYLRRAVRRANRGGSRQVVALSRMSLGYVLANAGRNAAALREVTAALTELSGADAGRARMQRGVVLHFSGHYEEAIADYGAAIDIAQAEGDLVLEARARNNRGLLRVNRGAAGVGDLDRSAAIFAQIGLDVAAADVRWNAGIAAAQRGDVSRALREFAEVEAEYRRLDVPRPAFVLDRLELLLAIPLLDEAAVVAEETVAELRRRAMDSDLAEALLAQSRVGLLAGDFDAASRAAGQARTAFRRQHRPLWLALARHVELRAEFGRGTRSRALLTALARTAALLDDTGWRGPALRTRLDAARVAADLGQPARARELLAAAGRARRGGTASDRAHGWLATALLHRQDGDERAAATALRRGLAVLDAHRASLGATELRANSGLHGEELAAEGLDIAVTAGQPAQVFGWAERWRATALRMAPVAPPRDARMAEALAELRMTSGAVEEALLEGRPIAVLRRRQVACEQRVRELARQAGGGVEVAPLPSIRAVSAALGPAALVELARHRGRLLAVAVAGGRATLHDLGPLADVLAMLRMHRFHLRRLVTRGDSGAVRAAAAHAAAELESRLLAPLADRIGDRPLVIVPPAELHTVSWSALPSCAGRPVTVAPSAAVWLRSAGAALPDGPPVLVSGPRLPAGREEVAVLASAEPGAVVLMGPEATADAVTVALDGARWAHIAAHGVFRADNALLSTIELADGPLTAYALEGLHRPPSCVVLSACDGGLSEVRPGNELMGFTAILLGAGTRSLVASVLPVPAELTTHLMVDLHRRLRAGASPAQALAAAQTAFTASADGMALATAAAFVCFGAG